MAFVRWRIWWKAFRFHYTSASFMPGILGGMIAWTVDRKFYAGYFLLAMAGLLLNHMALNMTDDYYDFRHLIDIYTGEGGNPYAGGSGTLSAGQIQPEQMRRVFVTFYVVAISIGVFLGLVRGPFLLLLLAIGFFCAFFYTAPPIRFGYRGFGEVAQLFCFGPGIGLGAYFVQAQRVSWEAFWGTLPFGIMLFSMITINEIPDSLEDRKGGKMNLVARFGTKAGVTLFVSGVCASYLAIGVGILLGKIPPLGILSFLTLPIAYKTVSVLRRSYQNPVKMAPANLGMICIHNLTALLLMIAYTIVGFRSDAVIASLLPLLLAFLFYTPVARLVTAALIGFRTETLKTVAL